MEGIDILIQAISNVGFPIAISVYLIYTSSKRDERFTATIEELRQTVDNNTAIITRLYEKLGKE